MNLIVNILSERCKILEEFEHNLTLYNHLKSD